MAQRPFSRDNPSHRVNRIATYPWPCATLPISDLCRLFLMHKEPRKVREFRRREQEILDTALKLFLEQGEDSVTVEMIADAVGIGKGTIYKHFKSKAEIYLRLMLDYERDLNELLHSADVDKDKEALSRAYFEFRMRDPQRYRLFDRLEEKVVKGHQVPEMVEELHKIRASNFERLTLLIKGRISEGKLEDVPPYFHYCAAWALVHGAVALYHSPFWSNVLEDQEGFFQFLMDIGVRMGNKRKHSPELPGAEKSGETPAT
ncbi:hypothetical protein ALP29_04634 [Pseudomonas syringae pv. avii]|uniref:HTH tetR-type domain-containing protein n=7 Tax=Pseudomonadati TaxID=3379134 RepID=A0A3M5UIW6_PSESX|nr:hypothetical protein ALP43_04749 [Pseudomonas azotoformans]RMU45443.1 hypothetical protein ALP29_04634 [Pseudomonas syringae pv. avii]